MPIDVQADELVATHNYGNNYGTFAYWPNLQADNYQVRDVYAAHYTTIKNANYVIENMPKLVGAGSSLAAKEQEAVKKIIGLAYFSRAYCYLNLALRYGKPYKEATASTELSVPVHKVYNYQAKPPRSTNKEVYDLILSDLAEAANGLANSAGGANAHKVTLDAVKAVKARTLLYMEKYTEALQVANELIGSGVYALMSPSLDNMKHFWFEDGVNLKETIYLPKVDFPDEANLSQSFYMLPNGKTSQFGPYYLPNQPIIDLYEDIDTRKEVYFWSGETLVIGGKPYTDLKLVGKWRGNKAYATTDNEHWGKVPIGRMRPKILRIAEQYLIAAEAAYHTGGDALTPLNALRVSRGLATLTGLAGEELFQAIQDERQRELAFEGFRLLDLRRWGKDVVRKNPQPTTNPVGYYVPELAVITYKAGDDRFVWPIPFQDVKVSGEGVVKQNPGY